MNCLCEVTTADLLLIKANLNKIKFDLIQIKIDQLIQSSLQSWQLRQSKYAHIVIDASPIRSHVGGLPLSPPSITTISLLIAEADNKFR